MLYYVEIDVMGDDAVEWAASFGCTASEPINTPTQWTSYRISADSHEELEALLADGGYDPDTVFIYVS